MTKIEKFDFIIKLLDLRFIAIAKKLEISHTYITHWIKNKKLKMLHLYAFSSAYDVPMIIFTDDSINTKEKIEIYIKHIRIKSSFTNPIRLLEKIQGSWFVYFHSTLNQTAILTEATLIIDKNLSVEFTVNEFKYKGNIFIENDQTLMILKSKLVKNRIYFSFDNEKLESIFFACMKYKNHITNVNGVNLTLFSKEKLDNSNIKEILGNGDNNKIVISEEMLNKSFKYMQNSILF